MAEVEEGKPVLEIVKDGPPAGFREVTEVEQMRIDLVTTTLRLAQEEIARWQSEMDNAEARLSTAKAGLQGAMMASKALDRSLGVSERGDIVKVGGKMFVRADAPASETKDGEKK